MKPSYSIDGQAVSWETYRKSLVEQLAVLREELQAVGEPVNDTIYVVPTGDVRG